MALGARLGRYAIERLLGKGGMGSVYLARQDGVDRAVVVKVVNPDCARDPVAVARLSREARAAARVDSDHVVRVFESGVELGTPYIAMEYVEGTTVQAIIEERGRVPHAEATRLVLEAARGLRDVHAAGILHRDVKPGNILVATDGRVKLADFGICKLTTVTPGGTTVTGTLSNLGEVIGSPDYMSPEQAQEEPLDARTDLYSLGVTYYQLLTGELPFHADTPLATLARALNQPLTPPRALVPDLPPSVERACLALMARDKDDRPDDADAAIALLERAGRRTLVSTRVAFAALCVLGLAGGVALAGPLHDRFAASSGPRTSIGDVLGAGEDTSEIAGRIDAIARTESAVSAAAELRADAAKPAPRPTDPIQTFHATPFARRDGARLRAIAKTLREPAAMREALLEADWLDACDKVRSDLVSALAAADASHLTTVLAPLRAVEGEPPAAIAHDLDETKRAFERTILLVQILARCNDGARDGLDELLARLRGREHKLHGDDDDVVALILHLAAKRAPIPRPLVSRVADVGPLLAALRLDRPAPPEPFTGHSMPEKLKKPNAAR